MSISNVEVPDCVIVAASTSIYSPALIALPPYVTPSSTTTIILASLIVSVNVPE